MNALKFEVENLGKTYIVEGVGFVDLVFQRLGGSRGRIVIVK